MDESRTVRILELYICCFMCVCKGCVSVFLSQLCSFYLKYLYMQANNTLPNVSEVYHCIIVKLVFE